MNSFAVTNTKILRKGALVGSFDLGMPSGLIVRGAMLFEKDGRRWVGFPSKEWIKEDGTKGYTPFLEFASKEVSERFRRQVVPLAEKALLGPPAEATPEPAPLNDSIPW